MAKERQQSPARRPQQLSASAGGEHTLVYDSGTKSLFSAGACGLGWCRNHPLSDAVFRLRRVPLSPLPRGTGGDDEGDVVGGGADEKKTTDLVPGGHCRLLFRASYYHNLAVDAAEGRLWTWGCGTFVDGGGVDGDGCDGGGNARANLDGVIPALGPRATFSDRGEPPRPVALVADDPTNSRDPIAAVAAGAYHSVVLTASLGRVYTFGAGQLGQLGRPVAESGCADSSGLPVDPVPSPVRGLPERGRVAAIGAGFYNTFAVVAGGDDDDGGGGGSKTTTLYCSGENQYRQCGRGPRNLLEMTRVSELDDDDDDPVDRADGGYCHTLVKTLAGRVFSLGCGWEGQRGDGRMILDDDDDEEEDVETTRETVTPVVLPGGAKALDVAAGANHSVVLGDDGVAYAFGANDVGQCGAASSDRDENESEIGEGAPIVSPRAVKLPEGAGPVAGISAGYAHTALTTSRGRVFVFGQNDNGQLGTNDGGGAPCPRPVEVATPPSP